MTKQPWYGGGSGSGDLLDLVGLDGNLDGQIVVGVNNDLTGLDGQNYNRDDENVFRWYEPTVMSTLAASDDVSKSQIQIGSLVQESQEIQNGPMWIDRKVDLDGGLGV